MSVMHTEDFAHQFWSRIKKGRGCWRFGRARDYGLVRLPSGKRRAAHRVAWELTYGPIPEGIVVCHACDCKPCCRPDHLFLGTQTDNMQDLEMKRRPRRRVAIERLREWHANRCRFVCPVCGGRYKTRGGLRLHLTKSPAEHTATTLGTYGQRPPFIAPA